MLLVLLVLSILALVVLLSAVAESVRGRRRPARRRHRRRAHELVPPVDPGRERRAEQRARELLRSCVNEEEWSMYRDLGFIRVLGRSVASDGGERRRRGAVDGTASEGPPGERERHALPRPANASVAPEGTPGWRRGGPGRVEGARAELDRAPGGADGARSALDGARSERDGAPRYAYLIYPHKPIVAYEPRSRRLLSEYCVEFPDIAEVLWGSRLPDSDDVLAKWMALRGDEDGLLRGANVHLPGRQLDPGRVRRDLWRLEEWERRRQRAEASPR